MSRLRIYYPIRPFQVGQHFGENRPCVKDFGLPTQQIVNSDPGTNACPIGTDKLYPHFGMLGHNGTDMQAGEQPVYAACAGTVVEMQTVPARGLGLGILTDEQFELDAASIHFVKIRYWHLKSFNVTVGQHVEPGDMLGITDNTGYSSANHLHFEGQPMDKDEGGHPFVAFPNNGIGAAIDLEPFFTGIYADNFRTIVDKYRGVIALIQRLIGLLKP